MNLLNNSFAGFLQLQCRSHPEVVHLEFGDRWCHWFVALVGCQSNGSSEIPGSKVRPRCTDVSETGSQMLLDTRAISLLEFGDFFVFESVTNCAD